METNRFVNLIFNENENKILCFARIDNCWEVFNRVSVGESVTSSSFELKFNSVGGSKWIMLFYPKGQYLNGSANGIFSIYLKMISCDNQKALKLNVRFFIKSPNSGMEERFAVKKKVCFLYQDLRQRWKKFDLVKLEELYYKQPENFFLNDALTIGCELAETEESIITNSTKNVTGLQSSLGFSDTTSVNFFTHCARNPAEINVSKEELRRYKGINNFFESGRKQ